MKGWFVILVLTRKLGEAIQIGGNIKVTVVRLQGGAVRIGVEAPNEVPIRRIGGNIVKQDGQGA